MSPEHYVLDTSALLTLIEDEADAIIAAIAVRHRAILLHKDPEFEALADQARFEALPYKGT